MKMPTRKSRNNKDEPKSLLVVSFIGYITLLHLVAIIIIASLGLSIPRGESLSYIKCDYYNQPEYVYPFDYIVIEESTLCNGYWEGGYACGDNCVTPSVCIGSFYINGNLESVCRIIYMF